MEDIKKVTPEKSAESTKNTENTENAQGNGYYTNKPKFGKRGISRLRQQFNKSLSLFLVIAASILFYFGLFKMDEIHSVLSGFVAVAKPVIYGLGIAFLLNPIVKWMDKILRPRLVKKLSNEKKAYRISRVIGILAAITVLLAVIVALCNMLLPELYSSIRDMIIRVPKQLTSFLNEWNSVSEKSSTIHKLIVNAVEEGSVYLQNWMRTDLLQKTNDIMTSLTAGVISVVKEVLNFLIGIIISIYVLYSKELFSAQSKKILYAVAKPDHANMVLHITQKSNAIFSGFISGKIIDSAIIGVLCFLGLSVLNMPYTLLVSVIVGVTNVIPFFGPYIGAIPSALLILLENPQKGLYFIIFILVLQQLDGNIIGPKILGDSTGLSAFWVVFAILVSGGLFGIVGMLLGVPAFAVIYYIVTMLINHRLEVKNLPVSSASYDEFSYVESDGRYIQSPEKKLKEEMQQAEEQEIKETGIKEQETETAEKQADTNKTDEKKEEEE